MKEIRVMMKTRKNNHGQGLSLEDAMKEAARHKKSVVYKCANGWHVVPQGNVDSESIKNTLITEKSKTVQKTRERFDL